MDQMKAKQEVMIRARETQLAQKEREAKLAKAELRKQKGNDKANVMFFLFLNEISSIKTMSKASTVLDFSPSCFTCWSS